jgi:DNA-binding NtrC family response regulator
MRDDCPAPNTPPPGILVIDDDQMLLGLLQTVFSRRGFQVWTSASGHAALDVYRQNQESISVVLLDVCMPGMDGPQTLGELRRINPAVRCCFMSGHLGRYSPEELQFQGALQLFDKPFHIQPLAEQLWQLAQETQRQSA